MKKLGAILLIFVFVFSCKIVGLGGKVDIANPKVKIGEYPDGSPIKNGDIVKGVVTLKGESSDDVEVDVVEISFDEGSSYFEVSLDEKKENWSYTFDTNGYPDGDKDIFLRVKDKSEKIAIKNLLLTIDNTPPLILVTSANGYGEGNKATSSSISIKGEAFDNYKLSSVEMTVNSDETVIDEYCSGLYSWSAGFSIAKSATYYASIRAVDAAGNESLVSLYLSDVKAANGGKSIVINDLYSIKNDISVSGATITKSQLEALEVESMELVADLSLDAPTITVTNPSPASTVDNPNNLGPGAVIVARVIDNEKVSVDSIQLSFDGGDKEWDNSNSDNSKVETGALVNVIYDIPSSMSDGAVHYFEVYAEDENGVPNTSDKVYFRVNSGAPTVSVTNYKPGDYINATSLTLTGTIEDSSSVDSVVCKIDGSGNFPATLDNPGSTSSNWTCDLTGLTAGNRVINIIGSDGDNETSYNILLIVDLEAPEITFISPSITRFVNGVISIKGSVFDSGGSNIKNAFIMVGKESGNGVWEELTDYASFEKEINTRIYDNTNYSVKGNGDIWYLPVKIKAEDNAGNIITSVTMPDILPDPVPTDVYYIKVDNSLDSPIVSIITPVNNSNIGGAVRVSGTAFDDEEVYAVKMRLDLNGDGDFDDSIDLNKDGDTYDLWETESVWKTLEGNTSPWQVVLNENGELYKTETGHNGKVTIEVKAQDTKDGGLTGDIEGEVQSISVVFDDTIPYVENISPSDNSYVKKTITFTADFIDRISQTPQADEGISYMGVSLDNGVSYTEYRDGDTGVTKLNNLGYDSYRVTFDIDTTTLIEGSNLLNGQLIVKLKVIDKANYLSISQVVYSVDNNFPTGLLDNTSPHDPMDQVGSSVRIQGEAEDGVGVVKGVTDIAVYFTDFSGNNFISPSDGAITTAASNVELLYNPISSKEENIIYPSNSAYIVNVDSTNENGNDSVGDGDGFNESFSLDGNTYNWWFEFDSTNNFNDGQYYIHYVITDVGGNKTYYKNLAFIKNNKPTINDVFVGTDLNNDGDFTDPTEIQNYDSSDLINAINNRLYIKFNIDSGNYVNIGDLSFKIRASGSSTNLVTSTGVENIAGVSHPYAVAEIITSGEGSQNYSDDQMTFDIEVTDSVGISVSSTVDVIIANNDGVNPEIEVLNITDRKNVNGKPIYPLDVSGTGKKEWAYLLPGKNDGTDSMVPVPHTAVVVNGHLTKEAYSSDSDMDFSGKIIFVGKVTDNRRIKDITFYADGKSKIIANEDSSGLLKAVSGSNFTVLNDKGIEQSLVESSSGGIGHTVYWQYIWDTESGDMKIDDIAKNDVSIYFVASDYSSNNSGQVTNTNSFTVDVKPYIVNIITDISTAYNDDNTVFGRTSTGEYPVRENEVILLEGYNLSGATTAITIGGGNTGVVVSSASTPDDLHKINVNVGSGVSSGDIVVSVNSVTSENNSDSNVVGGDINLYASEPNYINNNILTNDRALLIWKFTALPTATQFVRYPVMKIASDNEIVFSTAFNEELFKILRVNLDGSDYDDEQYERNYTRYNYTSLALDELDRNYSLALNSDRASNRYSSMTFFSRELSNRRTYIDSHYNKGTNKRMIENNYNGDIFYSLRSKSPDMVVSGGDGSIVQIYLIYYDALSKEVRYRYGTVEDDDSDDIGGAIGNYHKSDPGRSYPDFSIVSDGSDYGSYCAIEKVNNTAILVAWYDSDSRALCYRYTTDMSSTNPNWSSKKIIDSNYAGMYVDMAVDSSGHIHFAYYVSSSGDLKYAYLDAYDSADITSYVVDSYLSVGTNISIDVGDSVYISYFSSSYSSTKKSLRFAKQINNAEGVDSSGKFTGNWLVGAIPTDNFPKNYKVNVDSLRSGADSGKAILGYATEQYLELAKIKD